MKSYFAILFLALFAVACDTTEEIVEEKWGDGTPKRVVVYQPVDTGKVMLREKGYYEGGQVQIEGSYDASGARQGLWKFWYKNGQLWTEGEYVGGSRQGRKVVFWENGKKRYEGTFEDDVKVGVWKFFDVQGNEVKQLDYSATAN